MSIVLVYTSNPATPPAKADPIVAALGGDSANLGTAALVSLVVIVVWEK